ncbi:MAG: acyl carrier protein [Betaproteobacteria bacterium]|nr:acyl carrier protein [Betaproteobacteria bacterium]
MNFKREVVSMLDDVLHLEGRAVAFDEDTVLLGGVPELDSMAVIAIISAIEERFGCSVEDDEIDGAVFATLGSLITFVQLKVGGK